MRLGIVPLCLRPLYEGEAVCHCGTLFTQANSVHHCFSCRNVAGATYHARGRPLEKAMEKIGIEAGFITTVQVLADPARNKSRTDITLADFPQGKSKDDRLKNLKRLRHGASSRTTPRSDQTMHIDMAVAWINGELEHPPDPPDSQDPQAPTSLSDILRRGDAALRKEKEKIAKYKGALGTEGFTAGAVEIFGYMGHDLRALLKKVAEASTYSSTMDLGLSPEQLDATYGFHINTYHSYIAVAVQKGVSRALRLMALGLGAQLPSHSEAIKIRRRSVIRKDRCFG